CFASGNLRANATVNATNATAKGLTLKSSAAAGKCTAKDAAAMTQLGGGNGAGSFPRLLSDCGKRNFNIFTGFNRNNYMSCVSQDASISSSCSSCFAIAASYGAANCKWSCFWGSWCGKGCLDCVKPKNDDVRECAGVDIPNTQQCR
ncbi:unnamed protein product, partial [Effrenium voratum]